MKVIKHGKKEFIVVCSRCGCEFTYTLDELLTNYPLKYVKCPDCGNECYHPNQNSSTPNDWNDWITNEALKEISKSYKDNQCPVCGSQMIKDISQVLTTYPPQYRWLCPHCGHSETRYESKYKTTFSDTNLASDDYYNTQYWNRQGCKISSDDWSYQPTITTTNTGTGKNYTITTSSECNQAYVDLKDVDPEAYERL